MEMCLNCGELDALCTCVLTNSWTRSGAANRNQIIKKIFKLTRRKELLYSDQAFRSTRLRKGMTKKTTEKMERYAVIENAPTHYMHKARQLSELDGPSIFNLKKNNVARCHIVADSNVRLIVDAIYTAFRSLKADDATELACLRGSVINFVNAMAGEEGATIVNWIETDYAMSATTNIENVMNELSHGKCNLYFGDAERNTQILHGLDVPLEDGKPTPNAASIINALNGLRIPFDIKDGALRPTRYKSDGLGLSSNLQTGYEISARFKNPGNGGFKRRYSFQGH